MAVISPYIGGKSLAPAMPKLSGNAKRKTRNPDSASDEKFCLSPLNPSRGMLFLLILLDIIYNRYG